MPPGLELILMLFVFGAIMYFLVIRPQNKRMRQHQEMLDKLQPGTRVVLTSGLFATILHVGEKQMIVELAPGVEVTIVKGHISRVLEADEEEFEYEGEQEFDEEPSADEPIATDEELREMFDAPSPDQVTSEADDRPRDER